VQFSSGEYQEVFARKLLSVLNDVELMFAYSIREFDRDDPSASQIDSGTGRRSGRLPALTQGMSESVTNE